MSKNIEMIKSFIKVMAGNEKEISLILPDMYAKDVYSIDYDYLKDNGYDNLIFDIDNTILPVNDMVVPLELIDFFGDLKNNGFNICIVSNNGQERVLPVAEKLDVSCLFMAGKPKKSAFDKALMVMNSKTGDTVMIGDQMLSDIKGANQYFLYSILVDPVSDYYDFKTGTSRVLQNIMIKKLSKLNKFRQCDYYKNGKEK
ncbi:MAG: YqeG family HAD IIIA-type phosphatase [Bacilli bacterium]|nr:YqeG family HAD IIIA-type phosphatase [Bacilli bacterium]